MLATSRASGDSPQQSLTTDDQSQLSTSTRNCTNMQRQDCITSSIPIQAETDGTDDRSTQNGTDPDLDDECDDQPTPGLTMEEVKFLVDFWRPRLLEYFPFVSISPAERTEDVVREKPYLSISMAIAALFGDRLRQMSLSEDLLKEIGVQVLGNGTKVFLYFPCLL